MSVPGYQDFMLPMLDLVKDGREYSVRESIELLAMRMGLSEEDRKEMLPNANQPRVDNRIGWARTYLKKAGLIESPRRGFFRITDRGRSVVRNPPSRIDTTYLDQFEEFQEFRSREGSSGRSGSTDPAVVEPTGTQTPDEIIEVQFQSIVDALANEVLTTVKSCSPAFFERLVVDLLVRMGYGGSRKEAGEATRISGDEGIDGIIKEDRLGLDVIYLQAKRWENPVSRPELQKFAGALQGQRARKGIFITTSSFTQGAIDFCRNIDSKIILIDGEELAKLMVDFNVGVSVARVLEIKKLDADYFVDG